MNAIRTALPFLLAGAALAAPPEISNVRAAQRENSKFVDIWYDAADADGDSLFVRLEISDDDGASFSVPAFSLDGDVGSGIEPGEAKHVVWDAGTDWDGEYSDRMRVKVVAVDGTGFPGLEWGGEVEPGGFLLGQDGGAEGSGPSRHVNIPWSYWLSKYEITVGQYCDFLNMAQAAGLLERESSGVYSATGSGVVENLDGKYFLCGLGDAYHIRWNVNKYEVVKTYTNYPASVTWYGAMAWAQFYGYDLPTEAEWEKAARGPDHGGAGSHQCYTWGDDRDASKANLHTRSSSVTYPGTKRVGFYDGTQGENGSDMANGYGCYDMTGNADEWTRTLFQHTDTGNITSFGVADYPQTESLEAERNVYWNRSKPQYILKHGEMIYGRVSGRANGIPLDPSIGFRVCRRYVPAENPSGD